MAHPTACDGATRGLRAADAGGRGGGPAAARRRQVLLVEDNRNLRVTTSRMLEHLGFEVVAVAGGAEAVAAFRAATVSPDVVVLDVVMPGMDGMATLQALRQIVPGARVVMCSGSADDLERAAAAGGATAVLHKPYDVDTLAETLRRALAESDDSP
jgi:CheY-like chemotaxis protein